MEKPTQVINWAKESLLSKGYIVNGSPEIIQTTPWSSVTRFLTSNGRVFLKQIPSALSLEPTIIKLLHGWLHTDVPIVIRSSHKLNCYLMKDCGSSLREFLKHNFQPDLLRQAIKKYIYIQDAAKKHADIFIELGVPDWRLEKLPFLYAQLIDKEGLLKADGVTTKELNLLRKLYPQFLSTCKLLGGYKIPQTLDHCDFHEGNILIENNAKHITIIDWSETVITHPFFSLITFLNTVARRYNLKESDKVYIDLRNACFEKNNSPEAILLAKKLWPIYTALGFFRLKTSSNSEEFKFPGRLAGYLRDFIIAVS